MSYTLFEILCQMDPYVYLSNGETVATVSRWLTMVDPLDPAQYALRVDGIGRFLIYSLNLRGCLIHPVAFVELKNTRPLSANKPVPTKSDFGYAVAGYV